MGKPRLEDINERTLCKTRGQELAFLLVNGESKLLMNKACATCTTSNGLCYANFRRDAYGIVAYKQMINQPMAIRAVMNNREPESWDWQEADDKFKVGDWFEASGGDVPSFPKGYKAKIDSIHECTWTRDKRIYNAAGIDGYTHSTRIDFMEPCTPPAPVVLTPAQIAEIKSKYGNGGDVQISMDGKTVAL